MCEAIVYVICAERHLHLRLLRCLSNFVPPDGAPKVPFAVSFLHPFHSEQVYRQFASGAAYHRCGTFEWELYQRGADVDWKPSSKSVMDTSDVSSCIC